MNKLIWTSLLFAHLPLAAQEEVPTAPRLQVAEEDVLSSHTVRCGKRKVTFCKIRPLSLPPVAEPEKKVEFAETQVGAFSEAIPEALLDRKTLFVSASAYVVRDEADQPRYYSKVRYWVNHQEEPIELWTNANFVWLSGRIAEFEIEDHHFSLMLASSVVDVDKLETLIAQYGKVGEEVNLPDFPEFDDSEGILIQVTSGNPDEAALAPMQALLEYYAENRDELRASYELRKAAYEAKQRELLENPPEEKDLIIRYWRSDQPAEKEATIR